MASGSCYRSARSSSPEMEHRAFDSYSETESDQDSVHEMDIQTSPPTVLATDISNGKRKKYACVYKRQGVFSSKVGF